MGQGGALSDSIKPMNWQKLGYGIAINITVNRLLRIMTVINGDDEGYVSLRAVAEEFHITVKEIAVLSGLSPDTVAKQSRFRTKASQRRLRDIVLILYRVLPWSGSPMQAYAWFRSEPIPSFGDLTAEELVKRGMAEAVMEYIGRIAEGGYA
jgi:hypothetical protein